MFQIRRVRLEIKSTAIEETHLIYGFDIHFSGGLNIIAGENSKGKSTINKTIYYALGMEELLGARNERVLDKALRQEFTIFRGDYISTRNVFTSVVFLQLVNARGQIVTLKRWIETGPVETNSAMNTKTVLVYNSSFDDLSQETTRTPYFVKGSNNNENDFGFYHWLASFIDIDLPQVQSISKSDGNSMLYLQTIFPALFIEQTVGWSDILATMPYFGIPKNREKTVAFLLRLNELRVAAEKDDITRRESELKSQWDVYYNKVHLLTKEYSAQASQLSRQITYEVEAVSQFTLLKHNSTSSQMYNIPTLRQNYETELKQKQSSVLQRVGENKQQLRKDFERLQKEQQVFMERFKKFDVQNTAQRSQLDTIKKNLASIEKEIDDLQGIRHIIDQAIIPSDVYDRCPKCNQHVSDDLLSDQRVIVEKLTLDENLAYLKGQRKLMQTAIKSLVEIIDEKTLMRKYYLRKQREYEDRIKLTLHELVADDRDYSETNAMERVQLQRTITELGLLWDLFQEYKEELVRLSTAYRALQLEKAGLDPTSFEDAQRLIKFERQFKAYLERFEYSSNPGKNIFIQTSDPFKYFPVYKQSEQAPFPQPIKNNSSASDFVRTLWAYTLTLLQEGANHPGIIMFDEPGQHSVKASSLKRLFESCASMVNKQTILFTSIQKELAINEEETERVDLDRLLVDVPQSAYTLYTIPNNGKSITLLNN